MKFPEKLEKLSFMFFVEIQMIKMFEKSVKMSLFQNIKVVLLRILDPDSLGVNDVI